MTVKSLKSWIAAASAAVLCSTPALACDHDDEDGLDVAIVLSGSGAMAAAQVGAITEVERAGVPVHCIVGTSMGAVVGAIYSVGYTGHEIHDLFSTADWETIMMGGTNFREESFRRKEQIQDYFSAYIAGWDEEGLNLPGAYNSAQDLLMAIRNVTGHVPIGTDFDDLTVPYRAMGTSLRDGGSVTLAEGDLAMAALTSMSVPGLYPAREYNGDFLIDGGMSKQIPVDVAREMGADIVIVIDTTIEPGSFREPPSMVQVISQMSQIAVYQNWLEQVELIGEDDVHIRPDLSQISSSDFSTMEIGFQSGVAEGLKYEQRLREIAALAAPPLNRARQPRDVYATELVVVQSDGVDPELVAARFGDPTTGTIAEVADEGVRQVRALGSFGEVDVQRLNTPSGDRLLLRARQRAVGPNTVQVGARFSTSFDGTSEYLLLGRFAHRPSTPLAGETWATLAVGTDLGAEVGFYQPFGYEGRWFVEPVLSLSADHDPLDLGDVRITENWITQANAAARLGREMGLWGIISTELNVGQYDIEPLIANPLVPTGLTRDYWGAGFRFAGNTLDQPSFPTRGTMVDVFYDYYQDTDDVSADRYGITLAQAYTLGDTHVYLRGEAAQVEGIVDFTTTYRLGGFKRLSGFRENSIPTDSYGMGRVEVYQRLTAANSAGLPVTYIGGTLEYASFSLEPLNLGTEDTFAGSAYVAMTTPVGPFYLAIGGEESGNLGAYFFLGRAF